MKQIELAQSDKAGDTAHVIAPAPLVFLAFLALGLGLDALLPAPSLPALASLLGWLLIAIGSALIAWFFAAFGRAGTSVAPQRPTTALVTGGPYRISRNPGYLGMSAVCVGIALLANAPWALLSLAVAVLIVDRGVIAREERYLERRFGEDYLRYKAGARRWI